MLHILQASMEVVSDHKEILIQQVENILIIANIPVPKCVLTIEPCLYFMGKLVIRKLLNLWSHMLDIVPDKLKQLLLNCVMEEGKVNY